MKQAQEFGTEGVIYNIFLYQIYILFDKSQIILSHKIFEIIKKML